MLYPRLEGDVLEANIATLNLCWNSSQIQTGLLQEDLQLNANLDPELFQRKDWRVKCESSNESIVCWSGSIPNTVFLSINGFQLGGNYNNLDSITITRGKLVPLNVLKHSDERIRLYRGFDNQQRSYYTTNPITVFQNSPYQIIFRLLGKVDFECALLGNAVFPKNRGQLKVLEEQTKLWYVDRAIDMEEPVIDFSEFKP